MAKKDPRGSFTDGYLSKRSRTEILLLDTSSSKESAASFFNTALSFSSVVASERARTFFAFSLVKYESQVGGCKAYSLGGRLS